MLQYMITENYLKAIVLKGGMMQIEVYIGNRRVIICSDILLLLQFTEPFVKTLLRCNM
ncbi:hypothetical protein D3C86_1299510 [compost metagenome]